jgi:hypothetical protein
MSPKSLERSNILIFDIILRVIECLLLPVRSDRFLVFQNSPIKSGCAYVTENYSKIETLFALYS